MTIDKQRLREQQTELADFCARLQETYHPILASNRGPVELWINKNGDLDGRRGSGGVVTALSALTQYLELTWVVCAMSDGERRAVAEFGPRIRWKHGDKPMNLRLVTTRPSVYRKYYNVFANPFLWFLQHYLLNLMSDDVFPAELRNAWSRGYLPVNQLIAEAVVRAAEDDPRKPLILLQDYHLYLAAGLIRERRPDAALLHFVHIPWPAPRYWVLVPEEMRQAIWRSLVANDIVGFQTEHDAHNFLRTCESLLPEAQVDYNARTVMWGGRRTLVRVYPISVDVAALLRLARSRPVRAYADTLRKETSEFTIVRVDRAEPSKNVLRGFRAYDLLLARHPELLERVRFLAFLVPSRTNLPEYRQYINEVRELIRNINQKHGTSSWLPIELHYENNYPQAVAAMRLYDVLLVNAMMDGMNLVAKEGPIVNQRDGVLILTEGIGAHAQLKDYALTVIAADVEGTAQALREALIMPLEERRHRAEGLRRTIARSDLTDWFSQQLHDLTILDPRLHSPSSVESY